MNYLAAVNIGEHFLSGVTGGSGGNYGNLYGIAALVSLFLRISFVIAGLIILFYFIVGGIAMMSSAGNSDPKSFEQAKQSITSALIGFAVVFTAYWIVKLIGNVLGFPAII